MREQIGRYILQLFNDLATVDSGIVLLAVIIVAAAIVLDAVTRSARRGKEESGIDRKATTVSIDGSKSLPVRHYVSEMQGLAGKPDALISENGYIIPVERKPLARKIRDRYVAQLLVYMRLVEEFEGKKPPYGYLILGPNCRKFKIDNSTNRQAWLQLIIEQMRAVLNGAAAIADPHPRKCSKCDVQVHCKHSCLHSEQKSEENNLKDSKPVRRILN